MLIRDWISDLCSSDLAIYILYDQRYQEAGWILPMLALGMWPLLLLSTVEGSLLAIGQPKYSAAGNFAKFIYMLVVLPLANYYGGHFGVILAIALNDLPSYILIIIGLIKERLSFIKQDLLLTMILIVSSFLLLFIRNITGLGFPGYSSILIK